MPVAVSKESLMSSYPIKTANEGCFFSFKVGSFQVFVEDTVEAPAFFKRLEKEPMSEEAAALFQDQFERIVILDYVIRNTDRTSENWLMRVKQPDGQQPEVKIFAIDHGLAFPFKHPDQWRSYPYIWARLPYAKIPFSSRIRAEILPKLESPSFVESLCDGLKDLYRADKNFQRRLFKKQMNVLRGQIFNLQQVLSSGGTPQQLVDMPLVIVKSCKKSCDHNCQDHHKPCYRTSRPVFSWC